MKFYKKKEEISLNNEYIKMLESIKLEQINNVCFECGANDPEYISINNSIFICQECVQGHLQFPQEISQIIINDLYSLNSNEVKKLYLGGNKKLIEFINFDFPRLKQFPPNILYKTKAVEYYRKRLEFLVKGGTMPLKPLLESSYQLINIPNENSYNNINNRKDLFLSPKINNNEKIFSTQLTPILEGNQLEDENNISSYSEQKDENCNEKIEEKKSNILSILDNNIKNESTFIYSPQKPRTLNGSNSAFISTNNSILNKSLQNDSNKNNKNGNSKIINNYKNDDDSIKNDNIYDESNKSNNIVIEEKFHLDKNISDIKDNLNINACEKNINNDNYGDDNTIRIIDGYMNFSKENDSSDFIKNNKDNNDSIQLNNKEKSENDLDRKNENRSNSKIENDQSTKIINISNIENFSEQSNKSIIESNKSQINQIENKNEKIKHNKNNSSDIIINNKLEEKHISKKSNKNENKLNNKRNKEQKEEDFKNKERYDNNYKNIIIEKKKLKNGKNKNNEKIKDNRIKNQKIDNSKKSEKNLNQKNKILKKEEISEDEEEDEDEGKEEEEEEEEERYFTKNIKETKIIYPKDFDEYSGKRTKILNSSEEKDNKKNKKKKQAINKHLKIKITAEKKNIREKEDKYDDYYSKQIKTKTKTIINRMENEREKRNKEKGFLNPFKYLKKSFQIKQLEKYADDSDEDEEEEEEEEENEEEEILKKKSKSKKIIKIEKKNNNKNKVQKSKILENSDSSNSEDYKIEKNKSKKKIKTYKIVNIIKSKDYKKAKKNLSKKDDKNLKKVHILKNKENEENEESEESEESEDISNDNKKKLELKKKNKKS